ncbi:uncharacterized protein LOC107013416 [Solanum pennellii]|uniref:Uncharacterized protein LOC107013416 n=1 Tax=Solanum pennellii TaxID=28526 RepID=A0ABM1GBR9_SOLPN|nr:uncharacterized protein LOC107013416 [Solanum pennellii]
MGLLKYIFPKGDGTKKLAKWQMLLSEFDIAYLTQKAIKAQTLADHLAENPVDEEYEPLKTYFHDEEVSFVGEDLSKIYHGWRLFFDGAANWQGSLYSWSENGHRHGCPQVVGYWRFKSIDSSGSRRVGREEPKDYTLRANDFADAVVTIASMSKHPDTDYIDPLDIELNEYPVHCSHVEAEPDGLPWYFDIKKYLESEIYP